MSERKITILGSTGSVGVSTLSLLEQDYDDDYSIVALTANTNVEALVKQALAFRPQFVALADPSGQQKLADGLKDSGIAFGVGDEAILEAARMPTDWTMAAIVGAAGLNPTLEAVKQGQTVALANKEALVCAGPLFMEAAQDRGTTILPVDSEHNAIFQCLGSEKLSDIHRIILTASGGPFWQSDIQTMRDATPETALKHPTWSMGAKISIDSATMMNKGLEVIEACHLFGLEQDRVDVLVHPESVIHGLVEYTDGSWLAHLGSPDMRTPIAHALAWPKRMQTSVDRLDLSSVATLQFENPDPNRFPSLDLARKALKHDGTAPAILNAANEVYVQAFLEMRIGFRDIVDLTSKTLDAAIHGQFNVKTLRSFDDVLEADRWAREHAWQFVGKI